VVFSVTFPTRHTDTFAATGYVHAGVLLSLTELAYAEFEKHVEIAKPDHVVAVQTETHATYHSPLSWEEGAVVDVQTTDLEERSFTQEFAIRSEASDRRIATFVHHWVWMDTREGRSVELPDDVRAKFR